MDISTPKYFAMLAGILAVPLSYVIVLAYEWYPPADNRVLNSSMVATILEMNQSDVVFAAFNSGVLRLIRSSIQMQFKIILNLILNILNINFSIDFKII
jgi:hypothetical protein